jgi:hypothetical protein
VVWQVLRREVERAKVSRPRLMVVDVGGGTGGFAVPLAQAGHDVTVVDAADALAAGRRAAEAVHDHVRAAGDADWRRSGRPGPADLRSAQRARGSRLARRGGSLAGTLRPGGAASVLVTNRVAAVLLRATADTWTRRRRSSGTRRAAVSATRCGGASTSVSRRLLSRPASPWRGPRWRVMATWCRARSWRDQARLAEFELATAGRSPYRDVASQLPADRRPAPRRRHVKARVGQGSGRRVPAFSPQLPGRPDLG